MKIKDEIRTIIEENLNKFADLTFDASLKEHTTFRTGGKTPLLIEPHFEEGIPEILEFFHHLGMAVFVMGGGSNLLIGDSGLNCVVVKIAGQKIAPVQSGDLIYFSAFMRKQDFIAEAISLGYGGVEFIAGVPGTVGGGIFMNAGTYMGTFSDYLKRVRFINSNFQVEEMEVLKEDSSYREMYLPSGAVILGGFFQLPPCENKAALTKKVMEINKNRREKHPLEYPSAGSVFKNPPGHSSWKLIEDSGLRGFRVGGAMVSEKHTNFIVNVGGATSSNIYELIKHIQGTVLEKFGVVLETEIKIMGDF